MKISVKTNKNIIFFETLIALLDKREEKYHVLGEKILREYEFIKELKSFKLFREKYEQKEIPNHIYQYLFFSINLNDNLTPKSPDPRSGFGPKRFKSYQEDIYPLVKEIYEESNFDEIYKDKILPDYEKIAEDIQILFDKQKPEEVLMDFWKGEFKPNLVFIPNPLRVGGGSGGFRKNTLYSITGTVIREEGIIFKPSHMTSNLLHEYSHSFFKYYLTSREGFFEKNKEIGEILSKKIEGKIEENTLNIYGSSSNYFEETFMRAIQILLTARFFEKYTSKQEMEEKTIKQLQARKEDGFIYVENFYNELEKEEFPIDSYMKVLESL